MRPRLVALALFAAAALPLAAQPPANPPAGGLNPFGGAPVTKVSLERAIALHLDPAVQADLKLTADQKAALGKLADDALARHKTAIDKMTADRQANLADRGKADSKVVTDTEAALAKHLSADQMKRVRQLRYQMLGLTAFRLPDVAAAVKLTEDQEKALTAVGAEVSRRFDTGRGADGTPAGPPGDRTEAVRKAYATFVAGLTADQQAAWQKLAGEPSPAASGMTAFPTARTAPPAILTARALLGQLANNEGLQRELKLTPEQVKGVNDVLSSSAPFGSRIDTTLARTVTAEVMDGAAKVLTPEQAARLAQVRLQLTGLAAFGRIEVLKALKLTREQADAVEAAVDEVVQKASRRPTIPRGEAPDPDRQRQEQTDYRNKVAALEATAVAGVVAKFDAAQKRTWDGLVGPAFDASKLSPAIVDSRTFGPFGDPVGGPPAALGGRASPANAWAMEARRQVSAGRPADGVAAYDEALKLKPDAPAHLSGKAWVLATCPDDRVRDGKQAVALAEKAVGLSKSPMPAFFGTLAAAYAEVGRFAEAVAAQEKALAAATASSRNPQFGPSPTLPQGNGARLKLYQEKKPYRTPSRD